MIMTLHQLLGSKPVGSSTGSTSYCLTMHAESALCIATGGGATCYHFPVKESAPLKVNGLVGRSAPVVAAVAVGPAAVAALVLPYSSLPCS